MKNIRSRMREVSSSIKMRMSACTPLVDNKLHKYVDIVVFTNVNANIKWDILWLIQSNLEHAKYKIYNPKQSY
jgi:hypothetical protein